MRATAALDNAGIPYAVAGGNAVAAWVSRIDRAAVRNTQDVDILLRRDDLERACKVLAAAGFFHMQIHGVEMFLDGPQAKAATRFTSCSPGKRFDQTMRRPHRRFLNPNGIANSKSWHSNRSCG